MHSLYMFIGFFIFLSLSFPKPSSFKEILKSEKKKGKLWPMETDLMGFFSILNITESFWSVSVKYA